MPADTVAADPASLTKLAGIYRSVRTHEPLNLGSGGRGSALRTLRGGGWLLGNAPLVVENAPDGTPRSVSIIGADADTVTYLRVAPSQWNPTQDQLASFAGRYRSDEVSSTWTLALEGGRLVASIRGAVRVPMSPVYPDAFSAGGLLGTVWFTRDARGAVTEMHSGSARVWDFVFSRVK